ncbi:hypothetical protein MGN01_39480 [Methylobacterium gnaphalii]|uniref:Uncharacterized protein n=1 Tax=Methylobacterium gnaphalii TaxID=1010610 RepID=A0A512JQH8_9HYPH|nr:hypothetical protein MGN01_39480 [Methylobacterium gnaphalii]GLS48220.1 hypothetical protein GCM10007885_10640 [Methylobacterium gnaphalii]
MREDLLCLERIRGGEHAVALVMEGLGSELADHELILNDEHDAIGHAFDAEGGSGGNTGEGKHEGTPTHPKPCNGKAFGSPDQRLR